ncbi:hypothetical protein [Chromobacterium piscinae]|uniref:hypothetical protein n=1 Tax=Chromobacterium piscinae TaxID=686831 RepID=UPI00320A3FF3
MNAWLRVSAGVSAWAAGMAIAASSSAVNILFMASRMNGDAWSNAGARGAEH